MSSSIKPPYFLSDPSPTQRSLPSSPSPSPSHTLSSQRCSHLLLLTLLRQTSIVMLLMFTITIPLLILSAISLHSYSQYKIQKQGESISKVDIILAMTSTGHLQHCENVNGVEKQQKICPNYLYTYGKGRRVLASSTDDNTTNTTNNSTVDQQQDLGVVTTILAPQTMYTTYTATQSLTPIGSHRYLNISLKLDIFIQVFFLFCCIYLEYSSFTIRQKQKGQYIQDYSLEITNLPILHPYLLIPKLEQYLTTQINTNFQLITNQMQIFDITSAYSQQIYKQKKLREQYEMRISVLYNGGNIQMRGSLELNDRVQELGDLIKNVDMSMVYVDTVWVTFQTREARYLALRFLETSSGNFFMGKSLEVSRAPHPLEIWWEYLHTPKLKILGSHLMSLCICMGTLLLFDLAILKLHQSNYVILVIFVILIMEIVLKVIIIQAVTHLQKHKCASKMSLSLFHKLTKFLYLNTALILCFSSFNFGQNWLSQTFSSRIYSVFSYKWHKQVGLSMIGGYMIQIVYVNIRPTIQIYKFQFFKYLVEKWKQFRQIQQPSLSESNLSRKNRQKQQKLLKSQLDVCYAHLIANIMYANTFSFVNPIFYLFCSILTFGAYFSHKRYISKFAQPASYNTDNLNKTAIQYIYSSIIMHFLMVFMGYKYLPAFLMAVIGAVLILFRNTIIQKLSKMARKKIGPFCFSKFEHIHASTTSLSSLLNLNQLSEQINALHQKIKKYTYIYHSTHQVQDFLSKGQLERCIKTLNEKIAKLEAKKQNYRKSQHSIQNSRITTSSKMSNNNNKTVTNIKGIIVYEMTDEQIYNK